jgi:hypothetical protein
MSPPTSFTILSLATEWDSSHGGISTFNRELCAALARLGHRVLCGVPTVSPAERERARACGVEIVMPASAPGGAGAAGLYRPLVGIDASVDVLIGHGRITGPYAVAQKTDHFKDARYLHFVHMDPKAIEWHKSAEGRDVTATAEERARLEIELGRVSSLVAAVGPELQSAFSTYFHPFSRSVHCFLPGLFPSTWNRPPPDGTTCLVFGRAEDAELKGITLAAEAMGLVCGKHAQLSWVQIGPRHAASAVLGSGEATRFWSRGRTPFVTAACRILA